MIIGVASGLPRRPADAARALGGAPHRAGRDVERRAPSYSINSNNSYYINSNDSYSID